MNFNIFSYNFVNQTILCKPIKMPEISLYQIWGQQVAKAWLFWSISTCQHCCIYFVFQNTEVVHNPPPLTLTSVKNRKLWMLWMKTPLRTFVHPLYKSHQGSIHSCVLLFFPGYICGVQTRTHLSGEINQLVKLIVVTSPDWWVLYI